MGRKTAVGKLRDSRPTTGNLQHNRGEGPVWAELARRDDGGGSMRPGRGARDGGPGHKNTVS